MVELKPSTYSCRQHDRSTIPPPHIFTCLTEEKKYFCGRINKYCVWHCDINLMNSSISILCAVGRTRDIETRDMKPLFCQCVCLFTCLIMIMNEYLMSTVLSF